MPFAYEPEQYDFIETISELLHHEARRAGEGRDVRALWAELLKLDLPALLVPEDLGGLGLSPIDMVAVLEAAGRFALPLPLAMTIGPFTAGIVGAGAADAGARELSARVLGGTTGTVAPAWAAAGVRDAPMARLDGDRLTVESVLIPDADADLLAVPALHVGSGESVLVVAAPEAFGVSLLQGMDPTVLVGRLDCVDREMTGASVVACSDSVMPLALTAAAADLVGLATGLVERAVAYARDRVQFGQPIGHFQAVKHRLVDAHLQVERARSLTLYAALAIHEAQPDAVRASHRAKAAASEGASAAARIAVQVHGGSGITAEEPVSGLYLRARQRSMLLGGPDEHYACAKAMRSRLAQVIA